MPSESVNVNAMRKAGKVVAEMHDVVRNAIRPGVTTRQLDELARDVIDRRGATSNFLNYHGYPAVICASPNDVVVHGIPGETELDEGDIIAIDCGAIVDGWHGDAAFTLGVGKIAPTAKRLIEVTERSLFAGIDKATPGNRVGDIGHAVERVVASHGFSVVRSYVGHGIGRSMHEDPPVPNFGTPNKGALLRSGMALAIEPMVNVGKSDTSTRSDGWTVVTKDGSLSAHFEHTVLITDDGPEVTTVP